MNRPGRVLLGLSKEESLVEKSIIDSHPKSAAKRVIEVDVPRAIEKGMWEGETAVLDKQDKKLVFIKDEP